MMSALHDSHDLKKMLNLHFDLKHTLFLSQTI